MLKIFCFWVYKAGKVCINIQGWYEVKILFMYFYGLSFIGVELEGWNKFELRVEILSFSLIFAFKLYYYTGCESDTQVIGQWEEFK